MNPNIAFGAGILLGFVLCIIILSFNAPNDGE